jgi:hypothetical protein
MLYGTETLISYGEVKQKASSRRTRGSPQTVSIGVIPKRGLPDGIAGMSDISMFSGIGLYNAVTISSKLLGILNGAACWGICSGNGGSESGRSSLCRGAARKGSTVFLNDVNTSDSSWIFSKGKSLLLRRQR